MMVGPAVTDHAAEDPDEERDDHEDDEASCEFYRLPRSRYGT